MYQINTVPSVDEVTVASIDLEMFGQEKERLHQPHGTFASLGISLDNGEDYLISDQSMLQQVMDILQPVPVWVFQNATYDLIQLNALCNVQPKNLPLHYIWDTMLVVVCPCRPVLRIQKKSIFIIKWPKFLWDMTKTETYNSLIKTAI